MVPPITSNRISNFDATFWKRVNDTLDRALELEGDAQASFLASLNPSDPALITEVKNLLDRAQSQSDAQTDALPQSPSQSLNVITRDSVKPLATAVVKSERPRTGLTVQLAPVLGKGGERGFDDLLQRALRANRQRQKINRFSGERCGAWKLESMLGSGGMGEVWLATRADGLFEAQAAIKFLRAEFSSEGFEARFAQERALLARLNHPGIARLLDAGHQTGAPFLVLEYVQGMPLLDYVQHHAPTTDARLALIRQIGEAIAYAHSQLVVHRDLKPSNVLVMPDGLVKLLDFGVAGLITDTEHFEITESAATRLTGRGLTLEYAAPEQITGESSGVTSDVYSLGALAYHLLVGHRAYLPETPGRAALEYAILHTDPTRVSDALRRPVANAAKDSIAGVIDHARINADIDAIIAKAMRRQAVDRYPTAAEMVSDLRRFAERRPISTRREDRSYRMRLWLRRNWLPVGLGSTLLLALCAGLGASLWQYQRSEAEAARANRTVDFLVELLANADPDLHGGKLPTALDLLNSAAQESGTRFRGEPATEERLSRLFASVYRSLSQDTAGLPLARRAVKLSTEIYGTDALPTLRARSLLAWILYWGDSYDEALSTMQPVIDMLPKHITATSPEMLEARSRYGNILAGAARVSDSEKVFRALINDYTLQPTDTPQRAWKIADAEGDLAAAFTRSSRWQDAFSLLKKNADIYAKPPANDIKTALNHQGNLITVQNILGDPRGVEPELLSLIARWQNLAGEKTERIDELLNDLAIFYVAAGRATDAEKTYIQLRERANARLTPNDPELLRSDMELIEVRARFHIVSDAQMIDELQTIVATTTEKLPPTSRRYSNLILRSASVALGLGRTDIAQSCIDKASVADGDKSRGNALRLMDAKIQLSRALGQHAANAEGLRERLAVFDSMGEKASIRRASRQLDLAYSIALQNALDAKVSTLAAIAQTRAALPEGLPADHRIYRHIALVTALAEDGASSSAFAAARAALATDFKRTGTELPQVLNGFYVTPY
jgi:eukaryotic-like serine/threonine-protein kinase